MFLIEISLNFVPKGPIHNNPAFIQIMAWRRIGDKPLSEPMLTRFIDAYMRHWTWSILCQVMAYRHDPSLNKQISAFYDKFLWICIIV